MEGQESRVPERGQKQKESRLKNIMYIMVAVAWCCAALAYIWYERTSPGQ